jgi:hypothetical protein
MFFFHMQVVHFLELHSRLLGLKRLQPLSVLEAALFESAAKSTALSEVGAALVSLLVKDIYHVCLEELIDSDGDETQQRRDLQGGAPVIDENTWPFAAAAIFAGAWACVCLKELKHMCPCIATKMVAQLDKPCA